MAQIADTVSRRWSTAKDPLLLLLLAGLALLFATRYSNSLRGTDFPDFYCAARMVLEGHGHQLYDAALQRQCQAQYTGRVGTLYIHPPFEALAYLPVAWLPLRQAFRLWCLINLLLLAFSVRRLTLDALPGWEWRVLLAASLIFVPVLLCFLQGQDSILLLATLVFAFRAFRCERRFVTGCWLALGLFKFQFAVPLALILMLPKRRWDFVSGFGATALGLAALSAGISGWRVLLDYPRFLAHLGDQPFAGVVPSAMANFRGMVALCLAKSNTMVQSAVIVLLSAAVFAAVVWGWKKAFPDERAAQTQVDLAFANAVVCALLASYHMNPHDLTLLLLPACVLLYQVFSLSRNGRLRAWIAVLSAILLLPPLHLLLLQEHRYALLAIPLAAWFLTAVVLLRRSACYN